MTESKFRWMALATLGIEAALTPALVGLMGYAVDAKYETSPWFLIFGILLGLIGSGILLRKISDRMQNDGNEHIKKS